MAIKFNVDEAKKHLSRDAFGSEGGHPAKHQWTLGEKIHLRVLPFAHDGEGHHFHSCFIHYSVDGNNQKVFCNKSDAKHGGVCPICDWRGQLFAEAKKQEDTATHDDLYELAKKYWPQKSVMFQGLIMGQEDEGIKVFFITERDFKEIVELAGDDPDLFDLDDGGSYITVTYAKEENKLYPQRSFKTIKKLTGVPAVIPGLDAASDSFADDAEKWALEEGYDLVSEFASDDLYLPPGDISGMMENLGLGGSGTKQLTSGGYKPPKETSMEELEDFDEEKALAADDDKDGNIDAFFSDNDTSVDEIPF